MTLLNNTCAVYSHVKTIPGISFIVSMGTLSSPLTVLLTIFMYVHPRLTGVPILLAAFHMLRCIVIVWELRVANQVSKPGE